VCDYGSTWTKATLVGAVDGVQRLIATRAAPTPTTPSGTPNLHAATMDALQRMKLLTGVPESLPATRADGDEGEVEVAILPVGSSAPPMTVVVVAPNSGLARSTATLLADCSYVGTIHSGAVVELLANARLGPRSRPDAVIVVEGRSGFPPNETQNIARLFARTGVDTRLVPLLYCRPDEPTGGVAEFVGRLASTVVVCDLGEKPAYGESAVRRNLDLLYAERMLIHGGARGLPFHPQAASLSSNGAQSIAARFAAASGAESVLVVDVGGSSVSACYAHKIDNDLFDSYSVDAGIGLASGAVDLYARAGADALAQWLPFEPRADELGAWAVTRATTPHALPLTLREGFIEQAFIREAVGVALRRLDLKTPPALVIGAGALASAVRPQVAVVLLIDALTKTLPDWTKMDIGVDTANSLSALGALAAMDPERAALIWELDSPRRVAAAVSARGGRPRTPAVAATLDWEGGALREIVQTGGLVAMRAPYGATAGVMLSPARGIKLMEVRHPEAAHFTLTPSSAYPLPQVLLDARPSASSRDAHARSAHILAYLASSLAYTERELGSI